MSTTQDSGDQSTSKSDVPPLDDLCMILNAGDIAVLKRIARHLATAKPSQIDFPLRASRISKDVWPADWQADDCPARVECLAKLVQLGFVE